ncbi:hypothetical protein GNI_024820 [Gregarina niphandrodes]|uniref:Uncharacterized protein n=1 Tax=Gregarina niphandrodes TaxID=110365 RepID=A0A023BBM6_GRENI|nr:hypothetical protein GNI_024820 [Gregarina niphandrodes]EZG79659.1 hypothetical protein GNI_024820 [Gregarina niphandrodes]|eukprot:XP_011134404.1 hypothetical protein GNI_024820 [Gregarina niphandrodes]
MTYDPKLQGLEYHGCFVKDPQLTRHDGSLDRDSLKRQVYRQAQQDTTEGDYNIDYSLLPSVILVANIRTFSNNPSHSPVASGPKLLTMSLAVSLLPDAHPNDKFPLYIQDASLLNAEQLKF